MRIRRGPATVTGSVRRTSASCRQVGKPLGSIASSGRRGGRPGSQDTCLRPTPSSPLEEGKGSMRRMMWAPVVLVALLAVRDRLGGSRDRGSARRGSDLDDLRRPGHDRREGDRQGRRAAIVRRRERIRRESGPRPDDDVGARRARAGAGFAGVATWDATLRATSWSTEHRRRTPSSRLPVLGLRAQLRVPRRSAAASSRCSTGDEVLFAFDALRQAAARSSTESARRRPCGRGAGRAAPSRTEHDRQRLPCGERASAGVARRTGPDGRLGDDASPRRA